MDGRNFVETLEDVSIGNRYRAELSKTRPVLPSAGFNSFQFHRSSPAKGVLSDISSHDGHICICIGDSEELTQDNYHYAAYTVDDSPDYVEEFVIDIPAK